MPWLENSKKGEKILAQFLKFWAHSEPFMCKGSKQKQFQCTC